MEVSYVNSEYDWEYISYYENGQIKEKSNYKDWKKIGLKRTYYEDGNLESEINYDENGQIKGEWTWYDKDWNIIVWK